MGIEDIVTVLHRYVVEELLYDSADDPPAMDEELLGSGLLDSIAMTQLMWHAEETYGMTFGPDDLTYDNFNTLPALASLIAERVHDVAAG
jgi:acyl carrier protein